MREVFPEKFSLPEKFSGERHAETLAEVSPGSYPATGKTEGREVSRGSREFDGRSIPEIEKDDVVDTSKCHRRTVTDTSIPGR